MTNVKRIERITNLIESMDYKKAYIEIETTKDKFIIEKNKRNPIGFSNKVEQNTIK